MQDLPERIASYCSRWARWQLLKKALRKQVSINEWGIVCPYGIGDTYFVCALAGELMKIRGGKSIKFFVKNPHRDIPKMFGYKEIILKSEVMELAKIEQRSELKPGVLIVGHPIGFGLRKKIYRIGLNGLTFLDLFKEMLDMPETSALSKPSTSGEQRKRAKEILTNKHYIPKKTVILAPDAVSTAVIPDKFWLELAVALSKNGYKILFNKRTTSSTFHGYECLDCDLGEIIPISELAGTVISVRNGLCDLLSTAKSNLIVLYPNKKWFGGSIYQGSSLLKMGISRSAKEIIYKSGAKSKSVEEVLSMVQ